MDFTRKSRKRQKIECEVEEDLEQLYPHNVMLYRKPPIQDITLHEFEELALERLKVLRILEQASFKGLRFLSKQWQESVNSELNSEGLKGYVRLCTGVGNSKKTSDLQARRRDYISHFILRLAYCRSPDLKRWFVSREMELFKYKFSNLNNNDIKQFLEINNMNYIPLSKSQKEEVMEGICSSTIGYNIKIIESSEFYKVHFTEVLDLVRFKKCYLKSGFAYVIINDFVSIIASKHQNEIESGLEATQRLLGKAESDERLFYLLKGLHTSYTGTDYTVTKNSAVPIESIDQLAKKSFPLCMRMCHEILRTKHHHKHGGRLQYGLFLKGIGVTLEDSLRFWREEFTKIMDLEKFEKNYAYSVRHNYGKEGSMINYTPYSCLKIITSCVGPQETHGCPFKLYDQPTLKLKLASYGLSAAHVQEVSSYAAKGHYQLACGKYFEITHDVKLDMGINHPNQYFELSQTVMGNREPQASGSNKSSAKNIKRVIKRENNTTLMCVEDDDELWKIAETQESYLTPSLKSKITTQKEENDNWSGEFDPKLDGMEF